MCTIALAWRVFDDVPLVVGANREERFDRPAQGPATHGSNPALFAPTDVQAGGTWIGYNDARVFAAITNRPEIATGDRSRGLLLRDILQTTTLDDASALVEHEVDTGRYAGFNVVICSPGEATFFAWDGDRHRQHLDPGVHVITNRGLHRSVAKSAIIRARLLPATYHGVDRYTERLRGILADHTIPTCVHGDGFGTKSSSIIRTRTTGAITWEFADGLPCSTSYDLVQDGPL